MLSAGGTTRKSLHKVIKLCFLCSNLRGLICRSTNLGRRSSFHPEQQHKTKKMWDMERDICERSWSVVWCYSSRTTYSVEDELICVGTPRWCEHRLLSSVFVSLQASDDLLLFCWELQLFRLNMKTWSPQQRRIYKPAQVKRGRNSKWAAAFLSGGRSWGPGVVSCLWKKLQRVRRVAAGYSGDAIIKLFSHNCCVDWGVRTADGSFRWDRSRGVSSLFTLSAIFSFSNRF